MISHPLFQRKELISLSEALVRLDMAGAVKDIRRFNFVCKVRLVHNYYYYYTIFI